MVGKSDKKRGLNQLDIPRNIQNIEGGNSIQPHTLDAYCILHILLLLM